MFFCLFFIFSNENFEICVGSKALVENFSFPWQNNFASLALVWNIDFEQLFIYHNILVVTTHSSLR